MGRTQGDRKDSTPATSATSIAGKRAASKRSIPNMSSPSRFRRPRHLRPMSPCRGPFVPWPAGACRGLPVEGRQSTAAKGLNMWDEDLDARDLRCPLPALRAQKRLARLSPGKVLRVLATDPMARIDIPHFCTETGHRLLESHENGVEITFLIQARG
ncbi:sulfurtransferase TusA family protein [Haematobacter genomosp. 1]